jgi:hypothetical protein
MEFIQFKLDVNEQTDCTSFNRLNDTDVKGNHILKACEVDTIEECFDTCMAYSGSDDGPCTSAATRRLNAGSKNDRYRGHQCLCQRLHDYLPV